MIKKIQPKYLNEFPKNKNARSKHLFTIKNSYSIPYTYLTIQLHIINYPTSPQKSLKKKNKYVQVSTILIPFTDQPFIIRLFSKQLKKKISIQVLSTPSQLTFTVRRHTGHILVAGNLDTPR